MALYIGLTWLKKLRIISLLKAIDMEDMLVDAGYNFICRNELCVTDEAFDNFYYFAGVFYLITAHLTPRCLCRLVRLLYLSASLTELHFNAWSRC